MSETGYKTVYKGGTGEIEEKKSRFIASVEPVASEEEAVAFFNKKLYSRGNGPPPYFLTVVASCHDKPF